MFERVQEFRIQTRRFARMVFDIARARIKTRLATGEAKQARYCHCCKRHSSELIDWNSEYRDLLCPYCISFPRHRLLFLYLQEQTNFFSAPLKVLHFAPMPGVRKQFKNLPNLDYTTADLNNPSADVKLDVTNIPYADNTFDVIFCNHVLEHVMDDHQAMSELFRVLKPGGWASLIVPIRGDLAVTYEDPSITSPWERLKHFGQEDHVRWYGRDYPKRLEKAGFTVKQEAYYKQLTPDLVKKYGLDSNMTEDLYIGIKPASTSSKMETSLASLAAK